MFLVIGQALFAMAFRLQNVPDPWRSSTAWWTVYGTLADIACLGLLIGLTCREGLRLRDLLQLDRHLRISSILRKGAVYFVMILPLFLGGFGLSSFLVYGHFRPDVDATLLGRRELPRWAAIYSVTLWWVIWSATEELTYQAYLLQRLRDLSGKLFPAMALVGFWWAVQHSALPLIPDVKYIIWRFLGFVPGVAMLMTLYVRTRQLAPIIVAHWLMDLFASASTIAWHFRQVS